MSKNVKIIAEAGVNHNGSIANAIKLIDKAEDAGADFIKFQTFITDEVVTHEAKTAEYQQINVKKVQSQYELLKNLELSREDHFKLQDYCKNKRISFLSSAFDLKSLNFLIHDLNLELIKIPSGEITNLPYLRIIGAQVKPIIMSTGMSNYEEIQAAISALVSSGACKSNITLLHCNTAYPTPMKDVNLSAMLTLQEKFDLSVGFSDHTIGIEAPIAAVAMGAAVIEKHFTLDKNMQGPDHSASLEPDELNNMVQAIRNISTAIGDGIKEVTDSEMKNIAAARKSIVANKNLKANEILDDKNITTKRPGTGVSPMDWDFYIGKRLRKEVNKDQIINKDDIFI